MAAATATQLAIPGALVSVFSPGPGAPVDDRSLWQRAVLRASLSSAAKLVGLALASHTMSATEPGTDGIATCAPGLATLVDETGYSRTHVQRQISTLRTRGWLVAVSRPASGRPARFALSLPASVAAAESKRAATAAAATTAPGATAPGAAAAAPGTRAPGTAAPAAASSSSTQSVPLRRRGLGRPGGSPVTGRPSAAARRRARITGPALTKALTAAAGSPGADVAGSPLFPAGTRAESAAIGETGAPAPISTPAPIEASASSHRCEPGRPESARSDGAAWQILATLARAMRCGQDDFGDAAARLTAVLDGGRWSAAALATHLVDFVVGGVMVAGADPADSLGWRLDRLPVSERDCACRSCRSWQQRPATTPARPPSAVAGVPAGSPPQLAAIEQAAAAGTAQARLRATGAA